MTLLAVVVGTRPEAIKMAPVILALKAASWCNCMVIATAQHRQLLDQVFQLFGIQIDVDLNLMREGQTLSGLTSLLFDGLDRVCEKYKPDIILAQGDTTTVMVTGIVAFYHGILFGHVEAGLRTGSLRNPFPEEFNRVLASRVAGLHFAPTETARQALLREGVNEDDIFVTGNPVIDALLQVASRSLSMPVAIQPGRRIILLTAHRRENFGDPMSSIFRAVRRLVNDHQDIEIIYPVHPNPNVRPMAHEMLGGLDRVHLVEPLTYEDLVAVLQRCTLVLTDSGGLQEEAPALSKPVLVMRNESERPEAVAAGVAWLIGTQENRICEAVGELLIDSARYKAMARPAFPYGDGRAAERIEEILRVRLSSM